MRLVPWEIEAIEAMDDAYLAEQAKAAKAGAESKKG